MKTPSVQRIVQYSGALDMQSSFSSVLPPRRLGVAALGEPVIHTHYADGNFRLWVWNRKWLELASGWGLSVFIEFPSEWHEEKSGTIHFNIIWGNVYLHFPWYRAYEDHYQCSGPKFGFQLFGDLFWIYHGNSTGRSGDKSLTTFHMPWHWKHVRHDVLSDSETHDYNYCLNSGEWQLRKATIKVEEREWRRKWIPWRKVVKAIYVEFDGEIGERSGTWKGGTVGCGYDLNDGETPLECLRRMERDRKF